MKCLQCGRTIRKDSTKRIYLYLRQTNKGDGTEEVYVCGKRCLEEYNGGGAE